MSQINRKGLSKGSLTFVTTSGYSVSVMKNSRVMAWSTKEKAYVKTDVDALKIGQFLRLPLNVENDVVPRREGRFEAQVDGQRGLGKLTQNIEMPSSPVGADIRARVFKLPKYMSLLLAEFLGLMVADGCVFQSGFRLLKRHEDVVDRFEFLCVELFSAKCTRFVSRNVWGCEVNSTYIRSWLESIGGLKPNCKYIPQQVLDSSLRTQCSFLRGLFEDGTVNVKGDRLDHLSLTTAYVDMAKTVQAMLLRIGIISSVFDVVNQGHRCWRVNIYGYNASLFAKRIAFVSSFKNTQLQTPSGPENRYLIPVDASTVREVEGKPWVRRNALNRGYVSRDAARQLGLTDALKFHHERIESIGENV